jgi:hypothetical protein
MPTLDSFKNLHRSQLKRYSQISNEKEVAPFLLPFSKVLGLEIFWRTFCDFAPDLNSIKFHFPWDPY